MDENTDEMLQQMLQHDAHQSFLRKRQVFSGTPSEAKSQHRVRMPLSEVASNAVTLHNGLSSALGRAKSATELPQHNAEVENSGNTRISRFHEAFKDERAPGRNAVGIDRQDMGMQWVMTCIPGKDGLADLHQLGFIERPANNAQFFARLRLEYEANCIQPFPRLGWLSPLRRKVTKIQFVQFQTKFHGPKVGIQIVEVIANPSLPSEDEQGWTCTLMRGTSEAPLPAEAMATGFYGDTTRYHGADIYDWVPRKVHDALPAEAGLDAWGLLFVEAVSWRIWSAIFCVLVILPIALGIRTAVAWALDKAIGVSVSGTILMLGQVVVALMSVVAWKLPQ
jgi:hypothetical protein